MALILQLPHSIVLTNCGLQNDNNTFFFLNNKERKHLEKTGTCNYTNESFTCRLVIISYGKHLNYNNSNDNKYICESTD